MRVGAPISYQDLNLVFSFGLFLLDFIRFLILTMLTNVFLRGPVLGKTISYCSSNGGGGGGEEDCKGKGAMVRGGGS